MQDSDTERTSPKSYGVAVALSAIFGVVGIHHFYIANFLHGCFDLGLFIMAIVLVCFSGNPFFVGIGMLCFLIDMAHTIYVTYRLLVGLQKDGSGLIIKYPEQP